MEVKNRWAIQLESRLSGPVWLTALHVWFLMTLSMVGDTFQYTHMPYAWRMLLGFGGKCLGAPSFGSLVFILLVPNLHSSLSNFHWPLLSWSVPTQPHYKKGAGVFAPSIHCTTHFLWCNTFNASHFLVHKPALYISFSQIIWVLDACGFRNLPFILAFPKLFESWRMLVGSETCPLCYFFSQIIWVLDACHEINAWRHFGHWR